MFEMRAVRSMLCKLERLRAPRSRPATVRATSLLLLVLYGCGEGLPSVPGLDISPHDRCTGAPPRDVDASASEIQCLVDNYLFSTDADAAMEMPEQGTNVPGSPICCEVCAVKDTADDICEETCKYELCSRARDSHIMAGQELNGALCGPSDCGFSFEGCMDTNLLHVQGIDIIGEDLDLFYAIQASCHAHADDSARDDGLFTYLEDLDGVPGAHGELGNDHDVVAYCLDLRASSATGMPQDPTAAGESSPPPPDDAADSTGGGTTAGEPPGPGKGSTPPSPCDPWAVERFWVRPTNNFGAWTETNAGVYGMDAATHEAIVTAGGISYTMFPCTSVLGAECIRIDRLSVQLADASSGLVMRLSMADDPDLMPVSDNGRFDVPPGAFRLTIRHEWDDRQRLLSATNSEQAHGRIVAGAHNVYIEDLTVASEQGDAIATLTLTASLVNTQPRTEIVESRDPRVGRVVLTARTFDADLDPVVHHWMIPGIGSWRGDVISPALRAGRHAVILYADDVHRARGVAARWLEIAPAAVD